MNRRGLWIWMLILCLMTAAGRAESLTLRTVSCFGGTDPAAEAYLSILQEYESETGNRVADASSPSNESWKTSVLTDFAAGNEPDVLFFFAACADSAPLLKRVVPIREINEAYPSLRLPESAALKEGDGLVYAIPARGYWEGLFLRTDLFEEAGAPLPADWDSLMEAIRVFREKGIVPIAVSLSDIPHYLAEMALLACADAEEQQARPSSPEEVPESWIRAMAVIRELYEAGAFPDDALATDDSAVLELFTSGKAAMRMDGNWLADSLPAGMMDILQVVPMPRRDGRGTADAYIGGTSMGFYLTRKAWSNDLRRDAAVKLLAALTDGDNLRRLNNSAVAGSLLTSLEDMEKGRAVLSPLQDAMNRAARERWLLDCLPAAAEGSMTPEECWNQVMSLNPFGE